jgi:receptor expression-enhancing protein 5/6
MVNLPPAAQKFVDDVDKKLQQPGVITDLLGKAEQKTGLKRLHILGVLIGLHALYLLFGCWAALLCNVTGFLYPAYVSINAIESASKDDDKEWLTYWVVFALLNVVEFFADTIVHYFPFYWLLKCAFLLYLYMPMTLGAQKLYNNIILPFYIKHHGSIDNGINNMRRQFEDNVKST